MAPSQNLSRNPSLSEFPFSQLLGEDHLSELVSIRQKMVAAGQSVCDLSMINPDIVPDRDLVDRLVQESLKPAHHRYAVSRGIRKLRDGLEQLYRREFSVGLDPEQQICVTLGSKDGVLNVLRLLATKGKRLLVGAPTYPAFLTAARVVEIETESFQVSENESQMLREIAQSISSGNIAAILLNFPHNPTGLTVSRSFWSELLVLARASNTWVVNDFTYGELAFNGPSASLLRDAMPQDLVVEAYSLSKAYSIPGWRIGAVLGNSSLVQALGRLKSQIDYGLFLPLQIAAAHTLLSAKPIPRTVAEVYRNRIRVLVDGLRRLGWRIEAPQAGASVWAQIPEGISAGKDSLVLTKQLLELSGTLALPGIVFGSHYSSFLRFAAVVAEDRLRNFLTQAEPLLKVNSLKSRI